jgi:hypothetical protein
MSAEDGKDAPVHADATRKEPPQPAPAGYETLDAHAGATFRAGLYMLGAMFLVAALVIPLYWLLARQEAQEQPRPATVIKAAPSPGAFPRLVTNEPQVLAELRAKEDAILNGYGWVEQDRGIARMPIADALRIVGGRGTLPVFPAAAGSGGTR